MIACDLHLHSIRSECGFHTLLEIVSIMKGKGFPGFALTDHSPALRTPRSHFSVMLRRLPATIDGVRVFKGIEVSILSEDGDLDLPVVKGHDYEIILASIHPHDLFETSQGIAANTRAYVNAMRRFPEIKVITHPYYTNLPVDMDAITDVAADTGTALEVNNSHLLTGKADYEALARMLELAGEKNVRLAVNSDGHVLTEMGVFDLALSQIEPLGFDSFDIVNRTMESTLSFLGLDA